MTTYSKICPKCQTACDLAATTCKRCKLKFGTPVEAAKSKGESQGGNPRSGIVLAIVGVLLIILALQVFGSVQEKNRRAKEIEKNSWDAYVRKRDSGETR